MIVPKRFPDQGDVAVETFGRIDLLVVEIGVAAVPVRDAEQVVAYKREDQKHVHFEIGEFHGRLQLTDLPREGFGPAPADGILPQGRLRDLVELLAQSVLSVRRVPDVADDLLALIVEIQAVHPVPAFFHLSDRLLRKRRSDEVDPFLFAAQRRHKREGVVVVDCALVVVDEVEEEPESFALFPMIRLCAVFLHSGSFRCGC